MKRLLYSPILVLLAAASCNSGYDKKYVTKEGKEHQTIRFMELGYGIGTTNSDNTDFKIKDPVDTIPLKLGTEFGIRYSLASNLDEAVKIQTVWTFPDSTIDDSTGKKSPYLSYNSAYTPNLSIFASYALGSKKELLPGKWFVSIYCENKLLYRKVFFLKK